MLLIDINPALLLLVVLGGHVDSTGCLSLGCSDSEYWLQDKVKKLGKCWGWYRRGAEGEAER